jgi:hypothetical protein
MKTSVWQYKPWWCQPWSIVLTGVAIIGGSWLLLHRVWVTALVTVPILTWMGYFLLVYPRLVNQMLADAASQAQESTEAE